MDRGARYRLVTLRVGRGMSALLLLVLFLALSGCHRGGHGGTAPPPVPKEIARDNTAPLAPPEWLPPAVATGGAGEVADASPPDSAPPDNTAPDNAARDYTAAGKTAIDPSGGAGTSPSDNTAPGASKAVAPAAIPPPETTKGPDASPPPANTARSVPSSAGKTKQASAPHPVATVQAKETRGSPPPGWAKSPEELVYRVDFIGITMGYARFRYEGKVSIAGKPVYHLNVRAWTSGVLSFIYPINETIDYYLDAETIAPIRQEFTQREKEKDDVALYNQETGRITYRYRQSGKIRKEVDTIPSVYDPVSVAYYFRWRDLGAEDRPRNVYGGRKVYQISSRVLGNERIRTEHGEVDTIAVQPVIRRDGKPDNKGDLKIWFSSDERRVPVRLYAKFHKIKDWTLVGELMPAAAKTGG